MNFLFDLSQYFYTPNIILPLQITNNLLNITNHDNSNSIQILITIVKDNTTMLNSDHITLNADFFFKLW
jgi:hypothetical protein